MKIKFNLTFDHFSFRRIPLTGIIKRCVRETLMQEGVSVDCEINILVTTDAGIREINRTARNIDKATDVLSFPMFDLVAGHLPEDWTDYIDPETGLCPLGDMAISLERAAEQADSFGHSLTREVGYLTIHSMLHLLGYDHLDEGEQKKQMRKREEEIATQIHGVSR